jgi:hypothetical protein
MKKIKQKIGSVIKKIPKQPSKGIFIVIFPNNKIKEAHHKLKDINWCININTTLLYLGYLKFKYIKIKVKKLHAKIRRICIFSFPSKYTKIIVRKIFVKQRKTSGLEVDFEQILLELSKSNS